MRALHLVVARSPGIRRGAAVFAGTTVGVRGLVDHLERGGSVAEFLERHPDVPPELVHEACALGLEQLLRQVPLDPVPAQASLLPRIGAEDVILNAEELGAPQVVGRRVRCPACRALVFESWPLGWDAHAATRCRGIAGKTASARKDDFKRRFEHLFR